MKKNVYKAAMLFFTIQSILITILLNNYYMKKYSFFQLNNPDGVELFLGFIILCLNLVALVVIKRLYISGLEAEQLKMTALKYAHLVEQNQIYRQHHHDIKNHLNVVLGLLSMGKYEELRDYLNTYFRSIDHGLFNIETGLDEIDVLLSSKLALAKSKDILVNLSITTNLRCSRKHILDLVAILGNVLDNALETVQGLDQPQCPVSIHFWQDPLEYNFEVTNSMPTSSPCAPELYFKEGFSTKQEGRGEGLFIVKRLTERLGGSVSVDPGDGQFRVIIEIPMHRLEE
ncbi:sensor histidine kinase [Desulfosporosinus shakirovi]|uniref:sensor histidine kinase n=1 Tax=Desulfosporosinus shakirovi TaxID=2885154 RepID=UPI001E62FC80|nr:GHKL domain-containing protein [Desulfosporosinus sp. SRJS8]MCB8817576.1 GHKL domain-containing protein [Desulfosporosinus sp. SRJS8]